MCNHVFSELTALRMLVSLGKYVFSRILIMQGFNSFTELCNVQ